MAHPYWPLFDLRVRTPRVELRYPDDALACELASVAAKGIHDPATMPFAMPWTDVPPPEFERGCLQYLWRTRAELSVAKWDLPLAVVVDGHAVGVQAMHTHDFAVLRAFETGSWLGQAYQGRGLGKEMRGAVLHLGFAGLDAEWAYTSAFHDNEASLGVTRALGYEPNGQVVAKRRDGADGQYLFRMSREIWQQRRRDDVTIENLEPCLPLFGLDSQSS
jgi:RimJ/RimL family protein N-acetyltransferase